MNKEQSIVTRFEAGMPDKTLPEKIDGMVSEVHELLEAVDGELGERRIATESTDVIIRCLGIIASLGFDATELFLEKVQEGINKYNDEPWSAEEYYGETGIF